MTMSDPAVLPSQLWPCADSTRQCDPLVNGDVELGPLERLQGDPSERIAEGMRDRQTMVVFGRSFHEPQVSATRNAAATRVDVVMTAEADSREPAAEGPQSRFGCDTGNRCRPGGEGG